MGGVFSVPAARPRMGILFPAATVFASTTAHPSSVQAAPVRQDAKTTPAGQDAETPTAAGGSSFVSASVSGPASWSDPPAVTKPQKSRPSEIGKYIQFTNYPRFTPQVNIVAAAQRVKKIVNVSPSVARLDSAEPIFAPRTLGSSTNVDATAALGGSSDGGTTAIQTWKGFRPTEPGPTLAAGWNVVVVDNVAQNVDADMRLIFVDHSEKQIREWQQFRRYDATGGSTALFPPDGSQLALWVRKDRLLTREDGEVIHEMQRVQAHQEREQWYQGQASGAFYDVHLKHSGEVLSPAPRRQSQRLAQAGALSLPAGSA
ncbi:unnamed protein product [Amoebophrya sp. A120]|nr:unnamed protein product [Amoebophrya sp. A120]|eukprot:GSA120T00015694001.1